MTILLELQILWCHSFITMGWVGCSAPPGGVWPPSLLFPQLLIHLPTLRAFDLHPLASNSAFPQGVVSLTPSHCQENGGMSECHNVTIVPGSIEGESL